jgi:TolA-binding protein
VAAGQRLVAHSQTGNAELSTIEAKALPAEPAPPQPTAAAPAEPRGPARPAPSWTDLLTDGNFKGVLALAHSRGIDTTLRRGALSDLVALSDAARYSGDRALARRGLLAQRERFASSSEAQAAAFLLGRMADDTGAPDEARRWYETYLRESPRGAFAAEALGRKLVVLVRSGDGAAASALAEQYLQRFGQGAHAAYAREVLQRP